LEESVEHSRSSLPQFDPESLIIRLVTETDLPALEWEGEFKKYRRMYTRLYKDTLSGRTLMWMIESPEGEMIGQAFVMLVSSERDAADGILRAYVFAFRVKPAWRNRGVGSRLMAFVEDDLLKRNFRFVTLNVAKENTGARRLYERLGYKVVGSKPGIWSYRDDQGVIQHVNEPAWRMMKRLKDGN
jgi:ribosomal protein S18 acetylase RimI-like enzyme